MRSRITARLALLFRLALVGGAVIVHLVGPTLSTAQACPSSFASPVATMIPGSK